MESARRVVQLQALSKLTGSLTIKASPLDHLAGARGAANQILNEVFTNGTDNLLAIRRLMVGENEQLGLNDTVGLSPDSIAA